MYYSFLIHSSADGHLLPRPGYYKQCCNEHWGTRVFQFWFPWKEQILNQTVVQQGSYLANTISSDAQQTSANVNR